MPNYRKAKSLFKKADTIDKLFEVVDFAFDKKSFSDTMYNTVSDKIEKSGVEITYIENNKAKMLDQFPLAYMTKVRDSFFEIFINQLIEDTEARKGFDLHEKGHIIYHSTDISINFQLFKDTIEQQRKLDSKLNDLLNETFESGEEKDYEKFLWILYMQFSNIAQDMEINSKLFGKEWPVIREIFNKSYFQAYLTEQKKILEKVNDPESKLTQEEKDLAVEKCDKIVDTLREGIKQKLDNKKDPLTFCHPKEKGWPEKMGWGTYLVLLVKNNAEEIINQIKMMQTLAQLSQLSGSNGTPMKQFGSGQSQGQGQGQGQGDDGQQEQGSSGDGSGDQDSQGSAGQDSDSDSPSPDDKRDSSDNEGQGLKEQKEREGKGGGGNDSDQEDQKENSEDKDQKDSGTNDQSGSDSENNEDGKPDNSEGKGDDEGTDSDEGPGGNTPKKKSPPNKGQDVLDATPSKSCGQSLVGEGNAINEIEIIDGDTDLRKIMERICLSKVANRWATNMLYYSNRGRELDGVLLPRRHTVDRHQKSAVTIIVDISGSVNINLVHKVIEELKLLGRAIDVNKSRIILCDTKVQGDYKLMARDIQLRSGGGTWMASAIKYVFDKRYMKKKDDKLIIISDMEDSLDSWVSEVSSKKGEFYAIAYASSNFSNVKDLENMFSSSWYYNSSDSTFDDFKAKFKVFFLNMKENR